MTDMPLGKEWENTIQKFSKNEIIGFYRKEKVNTQKLSERLDLLQTTLDRISRLIEFLKVVE